MLRKLRFSPLKGWGVIGKKDKLFIFDICKEFDENKGKGYYEIASEWYASKYLRCISERMLLFYLSAILMIVILMIEPVFAYLFPLKTTFPIVGEMKESGDLITVVRASGDREEPPAVGLARYLVEQYVVNRETYNYFKLDSQKEYVLNTSNSTTKLQYEREYLDISNPNSMLLKYQIYGRRSASVRDISLFSNHEGDPYKAEVLVEISHILEGGTAKKVMERISIEFDMPNLKLVYVGYIPFFFKVSQYTILDVLPVS